MKISAVISKQMTEKGVIKEEDIQIYQYGIDNGILLLLNMLTALFVGVITGRVIEIAIFLLAFIPLRSFAGGFHLDNKGVCYICSNLILLIPAYAGEIGKCIAEICRGMEQTIGTVFVLCAVGIIFVLSPVEGKKRKLDRAEKKHFKERARLTLIIQIIIIAILHFTEMKTYRLSFCISVCVIAALMITGKLQLVFQKTKIE